MLMKSIDQIKLKHEEQLSNSSLLHQLNSNKVFKKPANNNLNKIPFNPAIRSNVLRNYFENNERINETLAEENNSEN